MVLASGGDADSDSVGVWEQARTTFAREDNRVRLLTDGGVHGEHVGDDDDGTVVAKRRGETSQGA